MPITVRHARVTAPSCIHRPHYMAAQTDAHRSELSGRGVNTSRWIMKTIVWLLMAVSLVAAVPAQAATDWRDTSKDLGRWGY
jgi:hypothetical protein